MDVFDIPIIINNYNRLKTTKKLADDLSKLGYTNIHILDNNSTYEPLLEWYKSCPYIVKRLNDNLLWLAVYNSGYINEFQNRNWIVYTDSDIEINPNTPKNFIGNLIEIANKYAKKKVGLSLKIDDLPNNQYANHFKEWETKYWSQEIEKNVYKADVDTTFCIIKPNCPFQYDALRVGGDMMAKHIPWYTDFNNLDEEEKYYLATCSEWSTYKRYYYNEILNKK